MICGFGSVKMRIERNGEIVATLQGLPNHEKATRRAYIGFEPGSDIQIGDVVINPANERFHIIDVRNSFVRAIQIKAYSLSETEYTQSREKHETAVYNIGNAYGSVIGNSSIVINAKDYSNRSIIPILNGWGRLALLILARMQRSWLHSF